MISNNVEKKENEKEIITINCNNINVTIFQNEIYIEEKDKILIVISNNKIVLQFLKSTT